MTFAFNAVTAGAVTQTGTGAAGAAGAPNSLIGGGVSAPLTASANSGPALIGVTFAFNAVSPGAVTQTGAGADGAAGAPNSLIGGGVSAPLTASANSGPALIGVTFAFNAVSAGAVTQNGDGAAGAAGAAGAPNSLIGGGVSAPLTASANSGPALIGVTFAFNAVSAGAVTQNGGTGADGAGQAGASPAATGGGSTPTAAADLSAIGDPTALLGGAVDRGGFAWGDGRPGSSAESTEADAGAGGNGGAPGFLGNGRPGGAAFADSDEGIATGGAGSSAVIAGPGGNGGNADTSINRGPGLAADGKGGRGSDGGFFSPGGNADTSINRGTGLAADGKGGRAGGNGGNATSGDGNNQRPGEGGAGGNGGSPDGAGDPGKSGGDA